jgi:hypothetical protein
MFFSPTLGSAYMITGTAPVQNSSWDGKPVLRSIYSLSMLAATPQWVLVFDGGSVAGDIVQIQACAGIIDTSPDPNNKGIVACSFTDRHSRLRLLRLNIGSKHAFSILWQNVSLGLGARLRFTTELVPVPRNLYDPSTSGFPDLVMGVPSSGEESRIVVLRISGARAGHYDYLPCSQARGSCGMANFVSMAFTSMGEDLFAVDEQPSLWRWRKDGSTASGFAAQPAAVAAYIHPVQSAVWKVMMWSNNRLVLVTDTSVNLWTQCSPCPSGTVTNNASSAESVRTRCLCQPGTYNKLVDFRSRCTPCTAPGQACTGGFYRTMQDPVCLAQGYTFDAGCAMCTAQKDCPPKRLATGTPCIGGSTVDTINCTTCPNQCVEGTSFVSNDCAIDSFAACSACKSTCGANRYISSPCSIEQVSRLSSPVKKTHSRKSLLHRHSHTHTHTFFCCRTQTAQNAGSTAPEACTCATCARAPPHPTPPRATTALR